MTSVFDPIAIALIVAKTLEDLGVTYTVGGSIASSFAGEPRSTLDVDVVANLTESHVPGLIAALSPDFYIDEAAVRRAIRARATVNVIHQRSQLKVDLFVAGGTPLDEQQLRRRLRVDIGGGNVLHIHPPEDILLQKLRWYRKGGETSDRQWRDILAIVRVQQDRLDRAYLAANAEMIDVVDLLDRAFRDSAD